MNHRIKITLLGGSALATPKLFEAFGKNNARAPYDVVLLGHDQAKLAAVQHLSQAIISSFKDLDVQVHTSIDEQEALTGADLILNQIRVGGLQSRVYDETFPLKFNIPGEESVGPGGFNSALRNVPVSLDYARKIEKLAPHATFVNLTNPSSIVQYAIQHYTSLKVIGICDMPVTLIMGLSQALEIPVPELEFDWMGMNHFGWLTDVRHHGQSRMAEAMARLEKIPNLGTDLEIVRALGVIPANYLKYYFHRDRYIEKAKGHPVRGEELIQINAEILQKMKAWKPGDSIAFLEERGAVWYEKIIAPSLLALTEKLSGELILSVTNGQTVHWLPEDAIIEVPVPFKDGVLQAPRISEVPLDVQSMIIRNCAFEMLTAQAVVERDKAKAGRALLANLLVDNYTQVTGILDEIWENRSSSSSPK
jgi:6-phospho-beta-glucosidase